MGEAQPQKILPALPSCRQEQLEWDWALQGKLPIGIQEKL